MFEVATNLAVFLICAGFLAGFVDSIAGGGGLITVPALLLAGAMPTEALATNKLQGTFGAGTALVAYARAGQVRPREQLAMAKASAAKKSGGGRSGSRGGFAIGLVVGLLLALSSHGPEPLQPPRYRRLGRLRREARR